MRIALLIFGSVMLIYGLTLVCLTLRTSNEDEPVRWVQAHAGLLGLAGLTALVVAYQGELRGVVPFFIPVAIFADVILKLVARRKLRNRKEISGGP